VFHAGTVLAFRKGLSKKTIPVWKAKHLDTQAAEAYCYGNIDSIATPDILRMIWPFWRSVNASLTLASRKHETWEEGASTTRPTPSDSCMKVGGHCCLRHPVVRAQHQLLRSEELNGHHRCLPHSSTRCVSLEES
jgi:hypothetical protein